MGCGTRADGNPGSDCDGSEDERLVPGDPRLRLILNPTRGEEEDQGVWIDPDTLHHVCVYYKASASSMCNRCHKSFLTLPAFNRPSVYVERLSGIDISDRNAHRDVQICSKTDENNVIKLYELAASIRAACVRDREKEATSTDPTQGEGLATITPLQGCRCDGCNTFTMG
jgi:hypothetical protein